MRGQRVGHMVALIVDRLKEYGLHPSMPIEPSKPEDVGGSSERRYGRRYDLDARADPHEVRQCGDCLLWQGGMMRGRYPVAQDPGTRKQFYVRRRVWELAKGKPAPAGPRFVSSASCRSLQCVDR